MEAAIVRAVENLGAGLSPPHVLCAWNRADGRDGRVGRDLEHHVGALQKADAVVLAAQQRVELVLPTRDDQRERRPETTRDDERRREMKRQLEKVRSE